MTIGRDVIGEREALSKEAQELVNHTMSFMTREAKMQGIWPQVDHCDGMARVELAIIDWIKAGLQLSVLLP